MCSTGDVRSLRARNVAGEPLGDHVDVFDVLVAGDDECRDGDVAEPLRGRGIEPRHPQVIMTLRLLEGMTLHLDGELANRWIDLVQGAAGTRDPEVDVQVHGTFDVAALESGFLFRAVGLNPFRPLVVVDAGADEHERRHALGRIEGKLERGPATKRGAHNRRLRDACSIERFSDGSSVRDWIRLDLRVPESRQVDADDRVRLRKGVKLRFPHPRVRDARVHEHDGRPFAVDVVPDAHSSSTNRGLMNSTNVWRSQLASVTGVSARTDAVRGMCIASATSPK